MARLKESSISGLELKINREKLVVLRASPVSGDCLTASPVRALSTPSHPPILTKEFLQKLFTEILLGAQEWTPPSPLNISYLL